MLTAAILSFVAAFQALVFKSPDLEATAPHLGATFEVVTGISLICSPALCN
jgi:hypothetical protein